MRSTIILILFFISLNSFTQVQLPVQDSTHWTDFRDSYYNPNIDTIIKKFDSIFTAFKFYADSIIIQQALIIDSFRFSTSSIYVTGLREISEVEWDTIRFLDGTKQSTAYTP